MSANRGRRGGGGRRGQWGGGNRSQAGSGGRKAPQAIVDSDNPIIRQFQKFAVSLDHRHDKRERLVKLSRDVTIEASLQEGPAKLSTEVSQGLDLRYSESKLMNTFSDSFRAKRDVIIVNSATCLTSTMQIDLWNTPHFTLGFKTIIKRLARVEESKRDSLFQSFISEYGTHYMKKVSLGASFYYIRALKESVRREFSQEATKDCSQNSTGFHYTYFSYSHSNARCSAVDQKRFAAGSSFVTMAKLTSKGSKPTANNIIDWAKQDFLAPVPLAMQHHPIVNLFSDDILLEQQVG